MSNDLPIVSEEPSLSELLPMTSPPLPHSEEAHSALEPNSESPSIDMSPPPAQQVVSQDSSDLNPISRSQSVAAPANRRRAAPKGPVQLIADLPIATQDALKTFTQLTGNVYQNKSIGKNHEMMESMTCECIFNPSDPPESGCGPHSDCINRLTQIECLADDCRFGDRCQNKRFERKEYANIDIVLTEKKGFGLRAEVDIPKDTFIYEYIGDVVSPPRFKQRMRDYADEGIKHFYFMMLQKDEYVDATKSGGIGRFANHSCNPNCYVAKWTVGNYVRMGIFAKRNVQQYEELTFNYNVDRYGHQAQTCFCGEPNCVGFIGGKTQTDVVTLDDLYLDALGIDEDDMSALKGTKKKKGKRIDDTDFIPNVKPLSVKDVPKVLTAIRTTSSKKIITKLLTRIKTCEDPSALFSVLRLRGFSVMYNLIAQNKEDVIFLTLVMETMSSWPLLTRNKVDASKVPELVKECIKTEGETSEGNVMRETATKLLAKWDELKMEFRIPKRAVPIEPEVVVEPPSNKGDKDKDDTKSKSDKVETTSNTLLSVKRRKMDLPFVPDIDRRKQQEMADQQERLERLKAIDAKNKEKDSIHSFIAASAKAKEAAEEDAKAKERLDEEAKKARIERREKRRLEKERKKNLTEEEKEAVKEKRLLKLIGGVVVKSMSKHQKAMDHASFKKYAKDLTQTIADKEKKSSSYKNNKLESLSPEKIEKIKKFSAQYMAKLLHNIAQKKKQSKDRHHSSQAESSSAPGSLKTDSTPAEDMDVDDEGGDCGPPLMSVEEAMDLEQDDDSDSSDDEVVSPLNGTTNGSFTPTVDDRMAVVTASPSEPPDSTTPSSHHSPRSLGMYSNDPRQRPASRESDRSRERTDSQPVKLDS